MTVTVGTKLGPYQIQSAIGAGGMGEVFRAHDSRLGRDVAIKVLPAHLAATPDARARFDREARAISALNHPNICTLHDVGSDNGVDYLVMELLEGESLAARLTRGAMPMEDVLRYGTQIAEALERAHRQGVIHRDLKPGNIMLTKSGAKLLDFGLARASVLGPNSDLTSSPTMTQPLTAEGSIVGTFQYMSPEQLEGREADARSDIFALGAVLYEMATGQKAFVGKSQASLIGSIMKEEPRPVSVVQPMVPPSLDRVVKTCLAKDPDRRYQNAHDVKLQLEWVAEAGSQAGVPAPLAARRRTQETWTRAVALVSTLAVILLATGYFLKQPVPPKVLRFEITPPSMVQFMDAPRISPDGKTLAYSATDSTGATRLWVRPMNGMSARPLAGTEGTTRPFWSPDSRFLGFFAGGKLKRVEISGAPPVVICDAPSGADGSWGTKDIILFDGRDRDPIHRVSAAGGVATPAVTGDSLNGMNVAGWPEFLPDGEHFLFLGFGATSSSLKVGKLGSDKFIDLGPCESLVDYAPPGYVVFSRGGTLVAQPFSPTAHKFQGEPIPIAEEVSTDVVGTSDFSVSQDGVLVFSTRQAQIGQLIRVDREGRDLGPVTTNPGVLLPWLSPDERKVAVRIVDEKSGTRDIWIVDLIRGVTSRLTFEPGNENFPVWSADGTKILYYAGGNDGGLHMKNSSGAGGKELLLASARELVPTCWSRDGGLIFYALTSETTGRDVWALPLNGDRKPYAVLDGPFDQDHALLSPDGKWLAYLSDESGREEIYVESFPDRSGKWQISTAGGQDPRWRADSRELYYLSPDMQMMAVPIQTQPTFEAGVPLRLFNARALLPTGIRNHYDVSADGKRFYIVAPAGKDALPTTNVVVNWNQELKRR
jgi:eukaryotic-like serine/threonine-protein kinase